MGHGQVVAAVGEAGVGKSRLVYECLHSHRTQGWLVLESASVSYGKATPYGPVLDLLKRYAHVEDRDDTRTMRAKVTGQVLTLDDALQETVPALLWLLDALPDDHPFLTLDPPQRRERFGLPQLPAVPLPCHARRVPCRVGELRRRDRPRRRRAPDRRGGRSPREPHSGRVGAWSARSPPG